MDGSASSDLDTDFGAGAPTDAVPNIPNISDYWPDAPHRMGPAADWYPDGSADTRETAVPPYPPGDQPARVFSPPPRPRRRGLRVLLGALAVAVFLAGSGIVLARLVLRDDGSPADAVATTPAAQPGNVVPGTANPPVSVQPAPSATADQAAPSATASPAATALPFTSGTFELTDNVVELNLTVEDLGNEAVKFSSPEGSGLDPKLSIGDGAAKLDPDPDGSKGNGRLDVVLNSKVTWAIKMTGGVTRGNFALTGAKLRRIDLDGGASQMTMLLGTPDDKLPIRMTGGVNTWRITTTERVPVSVLLRDGAGKVTLNGKTTKGISRKTELRADGDDDVKSGGYGIDAVAGIGTLIFAPK